MRALTVQQPWAFAIATGHKTVENRTRQHPWTSAIGKRIAIHAGKAWDHTADPHDEHLIAAAKDAGHLFVHDELDPAAYDYGVILATAKLAGVHHGQSRQCRCSWNPFAQPDSWHLILLDVHRLRKPLPARGYQGLWTVPLDVLAQLGAAA